MLSFLSGGADNSTRVSTTQTLTQNNNLSDLFGANKSILNLGAGSSTIYTNSYDITNRFQNENLADLSGQSGGGAGGGLSAQLDAAVSAGVGDGASGGAVSKQGGGFVDSPMTSALASGKIATNPIIWLLAGGAVLLVALFLKKRKKK